MLQTENITRLVADIKTMVANDRASVLKRDMRTGINYYNGRHDIEDYRLFYFNNEGQIVEEKYRSNTKIAHQYFTELVDQKVQYLLSNPIEVTTEQVGLQEYLDDYIDEDFQLMLQELVEGASQKSIEYVFWKKDQDKRIRFKTADAFKIVPIYDGFYNIDQLIYYYDDEIIIDGKLKTVTKIQLWTKEEVFYFVQVDSDVNLDGSVAINPQPHMLAEKGTEKLGKGYGRVPFICLENNKQKLNDLKPIKDLIDDYDMMACALSNNLIDFDHPIYAVRGYDGDNLDTLVTNLKTKKTVGVGENGGIDVITTNIPVEARKAKLEIDKEAIYKFGMGFDSSQTGDGNITNVVILSRYSLLDLKCNKAEVRLRAVIKQMLELIVENINEIHNKTYDTSDIEITITRDVMANEVDNANMAKTEADTKQVLIGNIMTAAPRLDDRTVLELLAGVLEVDPDEVEKALEEQGYKSDFNQSTEVEDGGAEQVPEGDREPAGQVGQADG
ncbi:phage portal protein [Streptococcus ovis]|uniref:phage portal protein n=1 Tax=Streptococcus ovis TaxID=82806 RepID=UPI000365E91D|nr:phage portal protein [Streptococcus ovis]